MKTSIIILVLIVGAVIGFMIAPTFSSTTPESAATTTPSVSVKIEHIRDETATYKIDAEYPSFGIAIDAAIRQRVEDAIAQFKSDIGEELMTSAKNEFLSVFDSTYIGSDIISVRMIFSSYTGGAHPNSIIVGLNFDRATGRELSLDDALVYTGLTLEQVAAEATTQLKEKIGDSMFAEGAAADPANYSTFTVSEKSVTFHFQPYQVAAYAAGPQEVSFPRVR